MNDNETKKRIYWAELNFSVLLGKMTDSEAWKLYKEFEKELKG